MAKQLRVDVAELTDVGRRRTTNQDNLARRVPDDPEELERSGALFVVADGMGGHAAGEIASTVAVQAICTTYYEVANGDVLQSLAQAIKSANEAILTIARQNTERTGMGTTLVAAVLCQGILYVANIGDSRAYLIRKGKMRQLTEDHSWVAEQVRAGVLTEEQARSHVHRNVITRSLGTQPNVIADVFVERAREGDILLLCSDGLHGYIDDTIIADVAESMPPAAAAQKLVELANEAGGPDNITVSIVHISEITDASTDMLEKLQLLSDSPQSTRPIPIVAPTTERPAIAAPEPPEPIGNTEPTPTPMPTRQRRTAAVALRLAVVALLVVVLTGVWYVTIGPFAQAQHVASVVSEAVSNAHRDVSSSSFSSLSPNGQLAALATDQAAIQSALKLNISAAQRQQLQDALNQLAPLVTQALTVYDASAHIVPLASTNVTNWTNGCSSSIKTLVSLPDPGAPAVNPPAPPAATLFFGRNDQSQIVPVTFANNAVTCGTPLANDVVAAAASGNQLGALITPTSGATTTPYVAFAPASATPALTSVLALSQLDPNSVKPVAFAFTATTIAVVAHPIAGGADTVYVYSGAPFDPTKGTPLTMSGTVRSLSFGGNNVLYMLLDNGTIATYATGVPSPHPVGNLQIQPALPVGPPEQYTIATPVPTVTNAQADNAAGPTTVQYSNMVSLKPSPTPTVTPTPQPTATPTPVPLTGPSTALATAQSLTADSALVPYVVVIDNAGHRVIILQSSGLDLSLVQQYADATQLDHITTATVVMGTSDKYTLFLLSDTTAYRITLP